MAADKPTMKVTIVAADRPVWNGTAYSVVIPASAGQMGIMPDHEPVLTLINQGTVRVESTSGHAHLFTVSDGFAAFDSNSMTVAVSDSSDDEIDNTGAAAGAGASGAAQAE